MIKILWIVIFLISPLALAGDGIGVLAGSMTEVIDVVSGFVSVACLIVGASCVFASIVKYVEHRRNPLYVPLSTVAWLLIIGLLLLILPFAYMITENGIPFKILWGGI